MKKSTKLTIGFDLDNTLVNTPVIEAAIKELGHDKLDVHHVDWGYSNFPEKLRNRIFELFSSVDFMCSEACSPIKGAQALIRKLHKKGHEIVLITARVEAISKETKLHVNRLFPEIKSVYVVDFKSSKEYYMQSNCLDYWVDDAPHEVENAIGLGIKTYMVSNETTRYNWHLLNNPKIKTIKSVAELKLSHFK